MPSQDFVSGFVGFYRWFPTKSPAFYLVMLVQPHADSELQLALRNVAFSFYWKHFLEGLNPFLSSYCMRINCGYLQLYFIVLNKLFNNFNKLTLKCDIMLIKEINSSQFCC